MYFYMIVVFFISFIFLIYRADARSDVRSYNETIIRPVTRRLASQGGGGASMSGTSVRSRTNRSYTGTSEVRNKIVNTSIFKTNLS